MQLCSPPQGCGRCIKRSGEHPRALEERQTSGTEACSLPLKQEGFQGTGLGFPAWFWVQEHAGCQVPVSCLCYSEGIRIHVRGCLLEGCAVAQP